MTSLDGDVVEFWRVDGGIRRRRLGVQRRRWGIRRLNLSPRCPLPHPPPHLPPHLPLPLPRPRRLRRLQSRPRLGTPSRGPRGWRASA